MIRTVDKINGFIIQKVVNSKKRVLIGYQVMKEGEHDAAKILRFAHLSSARLAAHNNGAATFVSQR